MKQAFEREVLDRLITIETQLKYIVAQHPITQEKIHTLEIEIAECKSEIKSAHHRITGIYKTVAWVAGAITLFINIFAFIFTNLKR